MFKQKIEVPNKLSEITLGQYQKFSKIFTEDTDQDFLQKKMVEIFCGIPLADVNKIKYSSVKKVVETISKMFSEKPKLQKIFDFGGKEFGFHPQLSEMTFGEFVDADTFTLDGTDSSGFTAYTSDGTATLGGAHGFADGDMMSFKDVLPNDWAKTLGSHGTASMYNRTWYVDVVDSTSFKVWTKPDLTN